MKRIKKERSVLWAWAFSYIIVLFIPMVTVFINYRMNTETVKQGIIDNYEMTLDNLGNSIDNYLDMEQEFYTFAFNNKYCETLNKYEEKPKDVSFYNCIRDIFSELNTYKNSIRHEVNCMMYVRGIDHIVSNHMANKPYKCYTTMTYVIPDLMEYEQWEKILKSRYANEYFVGPQIINSDAPALFYAHTIDNMAYNGSTIFVSVPLSEIAVMTKHLAPENCLILNIGGVPAAAFSAGSVIEIPGEILDDVDTDEGWIKIHKESGEKEITYSYYIAESYLNEALGHTRNTFVVNVCITLIFGIVGAAFLLRRNYLPLYLLAKETNDGVVEGNEFLEIAKVYKRTEREKVSAHELLQSQSEALIGNSLLSMMKGRTSSLHMKAQNLLRIPAFKGNIALVGFMVPLSDEENISYDELMFFVVNNVFEELMDQHQLYRVEDGRFLFYLVDLQESTEEEWMKTAMEKVSFLCTMMSEKMGVSLSGVVSGIQHELKNIRLLYQQVMNVFEYQNVYGSFGAISTLELRDWEKDSKMLEHVRDELGEALRAEDLERALTVTGQFLDRCESLPFASVKMYAFNLFNRIIDIFQEYDKDPAHGVKILHYVEAMTRAEDMKTLREVFYKILEFVCDKIRQQLNKNSGGITEQIKTYVMGNYMERELNISSIAEHLERTPKHISKVFKDETGEGILDYINHIRIMRARELMADGCYKMEEIAEQVGYLDGRDFRRAFVKIMGMPPSKYIRQ